MRRVVRCLTRGDRDLCRRLLRCDCSSLRTAQGPRQSEQGIAEQPERDRVDIAVTRVQSGTSVSAATPAVLVVGTSVATDGEGRVLGAFAAATWAGSPLSLMLIFSAVAALVSAYLRMSQVDPQLDGSRSN